MPKKELKHSTLHSVHFLFMYNVYLKILCFTLILKSSLLHVQFSVIFLLSLWRFWRCYSTLFWFLLLYKGICRQPNWLFVGDVPLFLLLAFKIFLSWVCGSFTTICPNVDFRKLILHSIYYASCIWTFSFIISLNIAFSLMLSSLSWNSCDRSDKPSHSVLQVLSPLSYFLSSCLFVLYSG